MAQFAATKDGIGSYTLANGQRRFRVVYRIGPNVRSKGGFATKAAAQHWQRHTLVALDKGEHIEAAKARTTLAAYGAGWFNEVRNNPDIRPTTLDAYEYQWRIHIEPALGATEFRHLDTATVRRWHAKLKVTPKRNGPKSLSQATCAKVYRLLKRICDQAVVDGHLRKNPCCLEKAATEPGYQLAYDEPPTPADVRAFAAAVPLRYTAIVYVAGFGGLRWGEAAGLQRHHVDLQARTVRVDQQLLYLNGKQWIGPPKTDAGKRLVYLPNEAVAALRAHLDAFVGQAPDAYVFTGERGKWLRASNFRRRVWIPATEKVKRPGVRFHDLRHAAGTLAAQTGASTADLMARMGHASEAAAMRYQHATKKQQEKIATGMDALLGADNVVPIRKAQ